MLLVFSFRFERGQQCSPLVVTLAVVIIRDYRFLVLQLRAGMRGRVDLLQLADRHVRIDFRGREFGVSEHLLDVADIGSAFEHQRCHRVAERVAGTGFSQVRLRDVIPRQITQRVGMERFSVLRQEQRGVIWF